MLTDEQWAILEPLLQEVRTGAAWMDLLDRFPSSSTSYRRFSKWVKDGRLKKILETLARHLEDNGLINLEECFIDGNFVVAKKRGEGTTLMVIADASVLPVALHTDSANPHEAKLVQDTLNEIVTEGRPRRMLRDRAYDTLRLMKPLPTKELNLSRRIGRTAKRPHMVECFANIKDDGKSKAFLHGLTNSGK